MVKKDKVLFTLRFIISFGLLATLILVMRHDIEGVLEILKGSNKPLFILALSINVSLTVLLSYRLRLLMLAQGISLPMKDFIYLTFVGFFFNNFLPTAIGGDLAKAYYASKKTNNRLASYAAVLADRLFGFLALLLIAVIGLFFIGRDLDSRIVYAISFVFVISVALVFFLLIIKRGKNTKGVVLKASSTGLVSSVKNKLSMLYSAINTYRDSPLLLMKIIFLSFVMQVFSIVTIYLFILCIGGEIHLLKLFLIIPLVWAVSMLPSLNGLGVREGAFVYFLKGDIGPDRAFAISLLWLGLIILMSIIGGIMHLVYPVKVEANDKSGGGNL